VDGLGATRHGQKRELERDPAAEPVDASSAGTNQSPKHVFGQQERRAGVDKRENWTTVLDVVLNENSIRALA
jgi:hypothetical protein